MKLHLAILAGAVLSVYGTTLCRAEDPAPAPTDKAAWVVAYCGGPKCLAYKAGDDAATKLGYTNVKHFSGGISGWKDANEKCEMSALCQKCGQDKGSDACCKADAPKCDQCGMAKGSPGCCAPPPSEVVLQRLADGNAVTAKPRAR